MVSSSPTPSLTDGESVKSTASAPSDQHQTESDPVIYGEDTNRDYGVDVENLQDADDTIPDWQSSSPPPEGEPFVNHQAIRSSYWVMKVAELIYMRAVYDWFIMTFPYQPSARMLEFVLLYGIDCTEDELLEKIALWRAITVGVAEDLNWVIALSPEEQTLLHHQATRSLGWVMKVAEQIFIRAIYEWFTVEFPNQPFEQMHRFVLLYEIDCTEQEMMVKIALWRDTTASVARALNEVIAARRQSGYTLS